MLVVIASYSAKPGKRQELVNLAKGCVEQTRREAGCLSYRLCLDSDNDTDFVFVEEWADDAALDAHLKSAHLQAFRDARADLVQPGGEVKRLTVTPGAK